MLAWVAVAVMGLSGQVRFFCQDETRLGLKTISGRKITAKGIKPKGKVQWQFKATYLYGVVEPATGAHFFYEFTHLNSDCFQVFLNLVSQHYNDSILIIQLDQAGAHKAKRLADSDKHHSDVPAVPFPPNQSHRARLAASQVEVAMETAEELG
jgi:hypothetical protein